VKYDVIMPRLNLRFAAEKFLQSPEGDDARSAAFSMFLNADSSNVSADKAVDYVLEQFIEYHADERIHHDDWDEIRTTLYAEMFDDDQ
jgi:hypothetical protein